jgi:hypothetical protein
MQPGHLARDCQNPCTTCSYCNSFEHVIEECPVLLAKLQERRGSQQNPQIQLIKVEPCEVDPRVVVITRGGAATGQDRVTKEKIAKDSGVRKAIEKTQIFDAKKERKIFEEARQEFKEDQGSSSKTQPEIREYEMPHAFDQSASHRGGKEVSKLVSFLYMFIDLLKDGKAIHELQNLVKQYELGKIDPLLNRAVHQIGKKEKEK